MVSLYLEFLTVAGSGMVLVSSQCLSGFFVEMLADLVSCLQLLSQNVEIEVLLYFNELQLLGVVLKVNSISRQPSAMQQPALTEF